VGSRVVDLAMTSGAPKAAIAVRQGATDFPTLPSASSGDVQQVPIVEIGEDLRKLTDHLSTLVSSPEIKDSLVHLDSSLGPVGQHDDRVRPKVGPLIDNLNRTADQTQKLAASANALVSGDGSTQDASLPGALHQLSDAARSLRALADYLGRHPEAIIRGKAKDK
jgi:paraquat-inducible protein B